MLIAQNITKKFAGVTALNNVNLELHPGKVNAIIGENGAGKSTLMKVLSGVHVDYEGSIIYNNETLKLTGTRDAEAKGIVIIHQELNLVPGLSITENIFFVVYKTLADRCWYRGKADFRIQVFKNAAQTF